jgi:glyoxylase-like metal-dependent hydrolase (beta-lactamase superfamily II)
VVWTAHAQQQEPDFSKIDIKSTSLGNGVYALEPTELRGGGNITVSSGPDGILIVDSGYEQMHAKVMAALAKISNQPVRFIVNTHSHGDHSSGNAPKAKAGATVIVTENLRKELTTGSQPAAKEGLPILTFTDTMTLHFNGDEIYIFHPPIQAHTTGDTVVYFRKANVMALGDTPSLLRYSGGQINGIIAAIEAMLKVANPDTKIVAGHGPLATTANLQRQHTMLVAVRDRVQKAIQAGQTLERVVASKPTADFDAEWSRGTPAGSADQWVTGVYRQLSGGRR